MDWTISGSYPSILEPLLFSTTTNETFTTPSVLWYLYPLFIFLIMSCVILTGIYYTVMDCLRREREMQLSP